MKKRRSTLILMLSLVTLTLVSLTACGSKSDETQQELVEVTRGTLVLSVTGDGNLSLPRHRKLPFRTTGDITEVNVEEGDRATKGQVLARLDATSLEQAIKTAELTVNTAEIAVTTAEIAVTTAEINVKVAEDILKAAEIDLAQATDNFRQITYPYTYSTFVLDIPAAVSAISDAERQVAEAQEALEIGLSSDEYGEIWHQLTLAQENLAQARERLSRGAGQDVFGDQLLPVRDFWTLRTAQLAMEKAESAVTQAKNNRDKASLTVNKVKNDLSKTRNDLSKAENDLDKAKDELEKAAILAPFDGLIAKVNAKPGETLSAFNYATETIIEIIDPSRMELKAEVDEIDIPQVELGLRAIISFDALPDIQLDGEVIFISPLPREESGVILYEVKVSLDVPEGSALKPGMSASADIVLDERSNVLLVPSRAVTEDSDGNPIVKVMVSDQTEERQVVTGLSDAYQTEIVSGLSEGEVVVIERKAKKESAGLFG